MLPAEQALSVTLFTADALARAEGADRAKSHFISVMSHEMRTPLNGILGAVDMMRASSLDEGQSRYLDLILMSGEILQRHVETVLDIGSIEAGQMRIIAEPFDPAALARDLADGTILDPAPYLPPETSP